MSRIHLWVQIGSFVPLYVATRLTPDIEPHARRARKAQSEAANTLLTDLRQAAKLEAGPSSKSHCRALSAAAVGDRGWVGVDIEWVGAPRDHAGLSRFLLDSVEGNLDVWALYRLWTFREAYFKAFGIFPNLEGRRAFYRQPQFWDAPQLRDDYAILFRRLSGDFLLCALWRGGGMDFVSITL